MTVRLDPIVVTATKVEIARSSVIPTISVISSQELRQQRQKSVLALVSDQVPGVFVTERSSLGFGVGTGAAGGISVRGLGGNPNTQVLMMIDGRPQYMGLFGHPLPDAYLMSSAERIEVLRGPASSLYGSNAMGGIINVITRKPSMKGIESSLSASYGSFETLQLNATTSYSTPDYGATVNVSKESSEGHRFSAAFDILTGYVKSFAKLGELTTLTIDGSISNFTIDDPGTLTAPKLDSNWVEATRGYFGLAIDHSSVFGSTSLKLIQNFGRHKIYDGFRSNDDLLSVMMYHSVRIFEGNTMVAGVDYKTFGGDANNVKTGAQFGDYSVYEYAIYLQAQQELFGRMIMNGSLRYEKNELFGDVIVPQAGVLVKVLDETTVKGSVSKGFRSPTIRELYLFPAPTPTLKPEQTVNYEIGITQGFSATASVDLNIFQSEGNDLIRMIGFPPNARLENSGRFVFRGFEVASTVLPDPETRVVVTYGFLEPGNYTRSNPKHKIYLGIDRAFGDFTGHLNVKHIAGLFGADNKSTPLTDYTLLGARIGYTFIESLLHLHLTGENLLGTNYQVIAGYPMPGRALYAGVNVTL